MLDIRGLRGSSGALFPSRSRDRFARGARAPFPISGGNRAYFVMELNGFFMSSEQLTRYAQPVRNPKN